MTEYRKGDWIAWNGHGDVPSGKVRIQMREQSRDQAMKDFALSASSFSWGHDGSGADIIAYRPADEPVRGEFVLYGSASEKWKHHVMWGVDTHSITIPTLDGELIEGSVMVEIGRLK